MAFLWTGQCRWCEYFKIIYVFTNVSLLTKIDIILTHVLFRAFRLTFLIAFFVYLLSHVLHNKVIGFRERSFYLTIYQKTIYFHRQVPDYFTVIEKPMDLTTIKNKLEANKYSKDEQFIEDMALVFANCFLYNQDAHPVAKLVKHYYSL